MTDSTWTLAIDTSSVVCAALARDGALVAQRSLDDTRAHTEALMPMVAELCAEGGIAVRDINDVVVGVGPGPFTGLRVGIVTAHTLATLAGVGARGVCSLDVVARQAVEAGGAPTGGEFVAVLDARRKELYWARYSAAGERLEGPHVSAPEAVPALPATGPGALLYDLPAFGPTELSPATMALHGHDLPDLGLEALYLRKPDAAVPGARKSTLLPPRPLRPRRDREQQSDSSRFGSGRP